MSAATRARVMRAVRELDHVADARAKGVARAGTPTLAFMLEDMVAPVRLGAGQQPARH
ncbi:hypothetical protein AB0K80_22655 [Streptomyces sp. NPDC052682]|uniref:hypothetical protein n=1 Tax=Streptomyces sp. NPDC052682 TaxID=3154954 RepID=UPI003425F64B